MKRNLTTIGRITVFKSIIIPQLNYYLLTLPNPPEYLLKEPNSSFFKFIWKNKPDRISRPQIIQDYAEGGLGMTDIFNHNIALKVTCFFRLFDNNTGKTVLVLGISVNMVLLFQKLL